MNTITKKIASVSIVEHVKAIVEPVNDIVAPPTCVPVPNCLLRPIATRPKFLMGTGPTNFSQRVSEALCKPLMGLYMDETHQVEITIYLFA